MSRILWAERRKTPGTGQRFATRFLESTGDPGGTSGVRSRGGKEEATGRRGAGWAHGVLGRVHIAAQGSARLLAAQPCRRPARRGRFPEQDSDDQIIREICMLAPMRPRIQAAGLQCLKLQIAVTSPDPQTRAFPGTQGWTTGSEVGEGRGPGRSARWGVAGRGGAGPDAQGKRRHASGFDPGGLLMSRGELPPRVPEFLDLGPSVRSAQVRAFDDMAWC